VDPVAGILATPRRGNHEHLAAPQLLASLEVDLVAARRVARHDAAERDLHAVGLGQELVARGPRREPGLDLLDDAQVLLDGLQDARHALRVVLGLEQVVARLPADRPRAAGVDRRARGEVDLRHALAERRLDPVTEPDEAELERDAGGAAVGREQLRDLAGLLVRMRRGPGPRDARAPLRGLDRKRLEPRRSPCAEGAMHEVRVRGVERVLLEAHPVGLRLELVREPAPARRVVEFGKEVRHGRPLGLGQVARPDASRNSTKWQPSICRRSGLSAERSPDAQATYQLLISMRARRSAATHVPPWSCSHDDTPLSMTT
jgi:hypothetical protein